MSELKLQPNNGKKYNYRFLFSKSSLHKVSINALLTVDDFLSEADAIIEKGNGIEDKDIYNIVKKLLFPMLKEEKRTRESGILHRSIHRFSKELFGNEEAWKSDFYEFLSKEGVPQEVLSTPKAEKQYIVQPKHLYKVLRNPVLPEAFRTKRVYDDVAAYDIAKRVLFMMLRSGYNKDSDKTKVSMYYSTRDIVEIYAKALEGDKKAWQKDYDTYINDEKLFVVKMAARDGQFQEKALTIDELIAMKQQDDSLEDADENL